MTAVLRTPRALLVDLLVAVLVVQYVVFVATGSAWLVDDPRGMAGFGLAVVAVAAIASVSLVPLGTPTLVIAGAATFAAGVAALVWGLVPGLGPVLVGVFVAGVLVTWALTVVALRAAARRGARRGRVRA
ncbi:hypothetical protein [Actinomycetospora straminea]|uniref:Superfamily IV 4 TMS phage holin n=1 Tax=Actinomycetospora straminea TaxID=663607 RepID=A0ABP9EPS9_9PSEU|nr:hypothetical protein [Actinomycetospora straminea]MDD7933221.1 hypothetical protein [Actinomycetospora straminea]